MYQKNINFASYKIQDMKPKITHAHQTLLLAENTKAEKRKANGSLHLETILSAKLDTGDDYWMLILITEKSSKASGGQEAG